MGWISRLIGGRPVSRPQESARRKALVPADWATSPAHLAVLERFLSMRDATNSVPDYWEPLFGMAPQRVVDQMVALKLLEPAPLLAVIEFCHTGAELKKMLASRGLKVSGRKAEQAHRLIEADPDGMEKLHRDRKIAQCAPAVAEVVRNWISEQERLFDQTTDEVIAALRQRDVKRAISVADAYWETRFRPPHHPVQDAITIKTPARSLADRATEMATVFRMRPQILSGLRPEEWEGLALDYIVWQLMGRAASEKCMPGFTGLREMDRGAVLRMLSFYIGHQRDLAQWRTLGIKEGKILCCNSGSCDACLALDGKTYRLDKLPELPYKNCTCELGCRCLANAVLDF
jgi:hypothetical protein